MLRLENVATPLTAVRLVVPESVAPPGLTPSATVTVPVKSVATLPWASRAVTCTAGVSAAPAAPFVGCTVNASCVAAGADTAKDTGYSNVDAQHEVAGESVNANWKCRRCNT